MTTRLETLPRDIETLDRLYCEQTDLSCFGKDYIVPDDTQSEIRMLFNEALAGGPNMNGDGGPTLRHQHALDCIQAAKKIFELEIAIGGALKSLNGVHSEIIYEGRQ